MKHEHKCRLKAARHLPAARRRAQRLQAEAEADLAESKALKFQARLEDLNVGEGAWSKRAKKEVCLRAWPTYFTICLASL
jgi:hypothetical protein